MNPHAREPEPACPKAGAVLAIHLDGDVDASGFGFVCGETLSLHLSECASCQRLLQRARRLDAVLASTAGRTTMDHLAQGGASLDVAAQRWFATATTRAPIASAIEPTAANLPAAVSRIPAAGTAASVAAGGTDPRQRVTSAIAAACLVASAILAVFLLAGDAPTVSAPTPTPVPAATPIAVAPAALQQDAEASAAAPAPRAGSELVIADDAVLRARREARPAEDQEAVLTVIELQHRVADAGTSHPGRLAAARALFAASHPFAPNARNAMRALVDTLAGLGDRSTAERLLHGDVLDIARNTPHVLAYLQARLTRLDAPVHADATRSDAKGAMERSDLAVLTVAVRLHERDLDAAIRRVVRREPAVATTLAAALRCGVREGGATALMLDTWHDLAARGVQADDHDTAWSWFGGQAPRVFDDLQRELSTSRTAPRRLRCILGLGCAADDRTVPTLLALLQGKDHAEAHAAAFALAGLPHRFLRPLLPLATANDGLFLLRAALARAALPDTRSWPVLAALTASEQQLLSRATLAQFPEVAGWFRDRASALSD